jgi:DNA helicase-2/ATP-dependent DNA helicase PcrA
MSKHPSLAALRPSTIHSFAIASLLGNPGAANYPQPLRIADRWEQHEIVRPTLARRVGVTVKQIDVLFGELASNWEALTPEQDPRIPTQTRNRFLGGWDEHRRVYGYTMLAELPNLLREALRDHDDLVGLDYDLLIVDEYQDLNACDLEVIRRLRDRGCAVLAAGDDEQSIYSFRKAAPDGIRRFRGDFPDAIEYPLSLTRRCARSIVTWARHVVEGDPDRPAGRPSLTAPYDAPEGECALLSFGGHLAEARGVAQLVNHLIRDEELEPGEILVLMRGDWNGAFSSPIKAILAEMGIPVADPEVVDRALGETPNRSSLATLRLLAYPEDSLAWATLLKLEAGIGETLTNFVYERAREMRCRFGSALLDLHANGFAGAPQGPGQRAARLVARVREWGETHQAPDHTPEEGWGHWIQSIEVDEAFAGFTDELSSVIGELDTVVEADSDLPRFLGQIGPLGSDLAAASAGGVRFMSMTKSKGLTVDATVVIACEDNVVPRPDCSLDEERRLLFVAMTRSRRFLYCTWARRRTGPTARAGLPRVQERRSVSSFLVGGPVQSQDGTRHLQNRWVQP